MIGSPVSTAAARAALKKIQTEPASRLKLLELSKTLRKSLEEKFPSQFTQRGCSTQILPFQCGSAENALALARHLKERGIYVPAIRPPTVPKNECRLRFSLTSAHSEADVAQLLEALSTSALLNKGL
jgi:8-amino-7-oxononanoate synthase